jgi:hypothetical protein
MFCVCICAGIQYIPEREAGNSLREISADFNSVNFREPERYSVQRVVARRTMRQELQTNILCVFGHARERERSPNRCGTEIVQCLHLQPEDSGKTMSNDINALRIVTTISSNNNPRKPELEQS